MAQILKQTVNLVFYWASNRYVKCTVNCKLALPVDDGADQTSQFCDLWLRFMFVFSCRRSSNLGFKSSFQSPSALPTRQPWLS